MKIQNYKMKKIPTLLTSLLLTFYVFSQDTILTVPKSKIGKLYNSNIAELNKEVIEVDNIDNNFIKIDVLNIFNINTGNKVSGVRVMINEKNKHLKISYLDKNELNYIITCLSAFKSYIIMNKDTNQIELNFRTTDEFAISCFLENNVKNKWEIVVKSNDIDESKTCININQLISLIKIFEQCEKIINSPKK